MRFLIAGTHSGCGKTTAALALMGALARRGLCVASFKAGPDYIDPGFHAAACGRASHNLDLHLLSELGVEQILQLGLAGADVGAIEGAMGYYDGKAGGDLCSAHQLARKTGTPAVLVVDAAGSAASAAAVALGFCRYREPSGLQGVLLNRVGSLRHYEAARAAIERETGLCCVGYLRKDEGARLASRHLGLVPAGENADLAQTLDRLARGAAETVDLDALLRIAQKAAPLKAQARQFPASLRGFRLGVARDEAFGFYYEANLCALRAMGAELVYFSPLRDAALPRDLDGLYLGGGFPEVFAARLRQNAAMCAAMRAALAGGLRCYAECGGMLYLAMIGFLPLRTRMTDRLQRFGYVEVEDEEGGLSFPAHEFHYSAVEAVEPLPTAFLVRKGEKSWRCGYRRKNALAGYPHLHFFERPELIERLWLK